MKSISIKFGDSYFYHDDEILSFLMHQFILLSIVMVENVTYFAGETIFSNMFGPILDGYLNHYRYKFPWPSLIRGQDTIDLFELDYKNVRDPIFHPGAIDFFFQGEVIYRGEGCPLDPDYLDFMDGTETTSSQLVISESAATCIANQFARSNIGTIHVDNEKLNLFWGTGDKLRMDTTFLASHVGLFQNKLGANVDLKIDILFKDMKVQFGKQGSDVILDYTMGFNVNKVVNGTSKTDFVLFDEFKMRTTADMRAADDIVYIEMKSLELDAEASRMNKKKPIRDNLDLGEAEYIEFVDDMSLYMNYLRKYLNAVYLKKGLQFPYNP